MFLDKYVQIDPSAKSSAESIKSDIARAESFMRTPGGQLTNVRTSFFFELTEKQVTDNTIKPVTKKKRGRPPKIKTENKTETEKSEE
jgi:hypothetical protein